MTRASVLLAVFVMAAVVDAHHGSADYEVGREVTVSGTITEWKWTSPHTWVLVMYPSRREARAGLVKRIERAAGNLIVSRPWLDGR